MKHTVTILFVLLAAGIVFFGCGGGSGDEDESAFAGDQNAEGQTCTDADGDGYSLEGGDCGQVDCDDTRAAVSPDALEEAWGEPACTDGLDNDCDGLTDSDASGCYAACEADADCDDRSRCTGTETCVSGQCVAGTSPCEDDGLFCNGTPECTEGLAGYACGNSGNPCSDGNDCTEDTCDEDTDTCTYTCAAAGAEDTCCADDACTGEETCEAACATDGECDDGVFCNGAETCDDGACAAGAAPTCDDINGCTDDTCDTAADSCTNTCNAAGPSDACCSDDACAGAAVCSGGGTEAFAGGDYIFSIYDIEQSPELCFIRNSLTVTSLLGAIDLVGATAIIELPAEDELPTMIDVEVPLYNDAETITMNAVLEGGQIILEETEMDPYDIGASLQDDLPALAAPFVNCTIGGTISGWVDNLDQSTPEMTVEITDIDVGTGSGTGACTLLQNPDDPASCVMSLVMAVE